MAEPWGDDTDKDKNNENDMEGRDAWVERPVLSVVLYRVKQCPPQTTLNKYQRQYCYIYKPE